MEPDSTMPTYRTVLRGVATSMLREWTRNIGNDREQVARQLGDPDVAAMAIELGNLLSDADRSTLVTLLLKTSKGRED